MVSAGGPRKGLGWALVVLLTRGDDVGAILFGRVYRFF